MGDFGEEFWDISGVTFGRITVLNEYQGLYVATGIVQRRDVSILYSVIIYRFTHYTGWATKMYPLFQSFITQ